jgi:ATP-dependent DNA helicase RecG
MTMPTPDTSVDIRTQTPGISADVSDLFSRKGVDIGAQAPGISPLSEELTPHTSPLQGEFPSIDVFAAIEHRITGNIKKRNLTKEIKELIIELCDFRPVQLGEIAKIFKRHPRYIRDNYLSPMVESQELEYLFPDQPNHPQQAYRTKK